MTGALAEGQMEGTGLTLGRISGQERGGVLTSSGKGDGNSAITAGVCGASALPSGLLCLHFPLRLSPVLLAFLLPGTWKIFS